jgi:glutamyl/glutaminyl-tRNA synthetase
MNTRINPTVNGTPHLGHVYLALVNQHIARSTGGRFILRCEDDQTVWLSQHTMFAMQEFGRAWLRDLTWLGIMPDVFCFESALADEAGAAVHAHWPNAHDTGDWQHFPEVHGMSNSWYPYTRYLTARVAWLDAQQGIDYVVTGIDLLPRFSLYCDCCEAMRLPIPRQRFMPRLMSERDGELDTVSKTGGQWQVGALRDAGVPPERVLDALAHACLIQPHAGWDIDNIHDQPVIDEEML